MIFGITGGIGTGKSRVADILRREGWIVLDADLFARDLIDRDQQIRKRLQEMFGPDIYSEDGLLNRARVAERVFAESDLLQQYNRAIREPLLSSLKRTLKARELESGTVGLDAALIREWEVAHWFDPLIRITAATRVRIERLVRLRSMSQEEAQRRILSQEEDRDEDERVTLTLSNNSSPEQLEQQVRMQVMPLLNPTLQPKERT